MSPASSSDVKLEIGHVLFVDIVGYSKLLISEQSDRLQKLKEIVWGTEQFRLAQAEGKLLRLPTGDGGALVFRNHPEAPVLCAMEISKELRRHPELLVRMGIHSGPLNEITDLNAQANIAGAGINIAQRVMDCADAGHILLSRHVAEDLEQYPRWRSYLHNLGECEVKHGVRIGVVNLSGDGVGNAAPPKKFEAIKKHRARVRWAAVAVAVLVLGAIVGGTFFFSHGPMRSALAIPEKSIAVLPFENLSEDKANAYFAEGIQDEILTRLAKIADLKVISRTSTQHYKSAPENLPEIARELGVAHVLEGSVQKIGDSVRVNVQLIQAATDSHIWADTFDRKLTDILMVESDVAKAIADRLRVRLSGREAQEMAARPTANPAAYDAYLRGLSSMLKAVNTPENALNAQKYFREAVQLDPKFAVSWALLSYVDARGYISLYLQPTISLKEEARQAAETALTLQPNLGEAFLAKGQYHYACEKDYDTAVRYFEEAAQLLPNSSQVPESLAYVARRKGQWDRADDYFNDAARLDPRNVSLLTQHGLLYVAVRRFPDALRKFDQVLEITPNDVDTLALKAAVAQAEGDLPRAAALLAPLHPGAAKPGALETQIYQAILERNAKQIIPRLNEVLSKPDPTLGYYNGELRFWLGWAQEIAGHHAAAEETLRQARTELEPFLKEQPDNYVLIGDLALTNMGLGDKTAALTMAERAMAANPIEKDAVTGPAPIEILARVAAQTVEAERALAALEKLLSIHYAGPLATQDLPLTPALLRLDPMFDPLRNDPRFQKLAQSEAPKAADK